MRIRFLCPKSDLVSVSHSDIGKLSVTESYRIEDLNLEIGNWKFQMDNDGERLKITPSCKVYNRGAHHVGA
jgi:hypothetical protein